MWRILVTALAFFTLLACGAPLPGEDADVPGSPLAPWHLWGSSQVLNSADIIGTGSLGSSNGSTQLVRVDYGRPETWRFLISAQLLSATVEDGDVGEVRVDFHAILGVGRTNIDLVLSRFHFPAPADVLVSGLPVWRSRTMQPGNDGLDPVSPKDPPTAVEYAIPTDILVAESITIYATAVSTTGTHAQINCTAMVSPNVHIRPEWFTDSEDSNDEAMAKFRGGENGGT